MAIIWLVCVSAALAQSDLTGQWKTSKGIQLRLVEGSAALEIDGRRHPLDQSEEGFHPGSSHRFQSRLSKTPGGYLLSTRTVTAEMEADGFIRTHLLLHQTRYEVRDGILVVTTEATLDGHHRYSVEERYVRQNP